MNNENFHPVCKEPPLAHALHHWDEGAMSLRYEYNGADVITVSLAGALNPGYRHGSDGSMQSMQNTQQIYIELDAPFWADVTFSLSGDTVNMRPQRAMPGEAIIGQNGRILLYGVNGLYDADQDLLIDFHGCEWHWESDALEPDKSGRAIARAKVLLGRKPFFINLRMGWYQKHLGYSYHRPWERKPSQKAIAGWCSWEAFRREINHADLEGISRFMSENLKDFGLEYIQVDDGYQKMPLPYDPEKTMAEGWMACNEEKFPGGHKSMVDTITENGLLPAIWTNSNITNPEFPEKNPDAVLWHDGKPMMGEWIDFLYNCTPETLSKHVEPLFKSLKEAGFKYIKIDAIRHLLFDGLHEAVRLGIMSNKEAEEKFRAYMESTRKGMGGDVYYLVSWGEMHEVVGLADACRISMDANPTWAGVHMQLFESARWFFSQRILFLNDPDHVCVRTKPDWARSVLSLISLSGQLYMLSDAKDAYTPEKLEIIRKTLPPLTTRAAETGPLDLRYPAYTWTKLHGFAVQSDEKPVKPEGITQEEVYNMAGVYPTMDDDHPFSSLWAFHLQHAGRLWCVMGRFATVPLRCSEIPLSSLQLDGAREYHAFSFWDEEYLGKVSGAIKAKELDTGECQIVALVPVADTPQFIASSRHVSMDAVSAGDVDFHDEALTASLSGVKGMTESYYFHANSWEYVCIAAVEGGSAVCRARGGLLKVTVSFEKEKVSLSIHFKN